MKTIKKFSVIIIICLIFTFSVNIFADEIKQDTNAVVTSVIDADTLIVRTFDNKLCYVKMAGIKTTNLDAGLSYLSNTVLGQSVTLYKTSISFDGSFNYMNVIYKGKDMGEQMVKRGYAVIDRTQSKPTNYVTLLNTEDNAQKNLVGIWQYDAPNYSSITDTGGIYETTTRDKVNINTATKSQLITMLDGITSDVAYNIIKYRADNPFSNQLEIKFVKGFTADMYEKNKDCISVFTNLYTASKFELSSLDNLSNEMVDKIVKYRNKNNNISDNAFKDIVGINKFNNIVNFIGYESFSSISYIKGINRVNANFANVTYLKNAGLSTSISNDIIRHKTNGYTYKTLEELTKLEGRDIYLSDIDKMQDNIDLYTDLNLASVNEIKSIFGDKNIYDIYNTDFTNIEQIKKYTTTEYYKIIKDNIYINNLKTNYINLNTASKSELLSLNLSYSDIDKIINSRPIYNSRLLPFNIANLNNKISLYTNINLASEKELLSLGLNSSLAFKIKEFTKSNVFGSQEEIKNFFMQNGVGNLYENTKPFIVVR